jgi:N-acetyl-anhydromuramyl-L-alanine amidase AmpD
VLGLSAKLAADICKRHAIPIVRLSVEDLKAGKRGLCGHVDITNAFSGGKGHTDPGPAFPWELYLAMVHKASLPPTLPPPPLNVA